MEFQEPPEHRRHARVFQELPVRISDPSAKMLDVEGTLVDLSRAGLCLAARIPLDAGAGLNLRLRLPDGGMVAGDARVRWSRPQGPGRVAGLEIVRIGFWDRQRLLRHLAPGRLSFLKAGELALQCVLSMGLILLSQQILAADPHLSGAIADALPVGLLAAGPVWGLCMLARAAR